MTSTDRKALQAAGGATPLRVRLGATILIAAVLLAVVEAGLAFAPRFGGTSLRSMIYVPPEVMPEQYEHYLNVQHPTLGWTGLRVRDVGPPTARFSPAYPEARDWCVTLYGDSMTYADEVGDEDAWGNLLAQRLGCPVGNFGVGGYGTDQALLQFLDNTPDRAAISIVGVFPDNLLRNLNQYRYFLTGGEPFGMKPRFVVENDSLRLIPLPKLTYEQFVDGLRDPRSIFPAELFLPGSRHGPVIWSFPFTLSAINLARTYQVTNYVRGRPTWIDFAQPEDDSRALATTAAIIAEFPRRAAPGKTVIAILYPTPASYEFERRTGARALAAMAAAFEEHGVPTLDLTKDFAAHLGERSFCEMMTSSRCVGHYNEDANRVVADAVQRFVAAERPAA